jgi:hypothetical protein
MIRSPIARTGTLKPARLICRTVTSNELVGLGCCLVFRTRVTQSLQKGAQILHGWLELLSQGIAISHEVEPPRLYAPVADGVRLLLAPQLCRLQLVYHKVVILDRHCQALHNGKSVNNLALKSVVRNQPKLWNQRVENRKWGFGEREHEVKRSAWRANSKVARNATICVFECCFDFGAKASDHARNFRSMGIFIASALDLGLLPRYPNRDQNCPDRADRLEPARPVVSVKGKVIADRYRGDRQSQSSIKDKCGRASDTAESSCHYGILA